MIPANLIALGEDFVARLRSYIRRRVPSSADGDDVLQSVLLALVTKGPRSGGPIDRWLFEVARASIAEYYRGRQRRSAVDEDVETLGTGTPEDAAAILHCIQPLLATLPSSDQDLLRRVEVEGVAQTALARELGLSNSGMKSRVQRARNRLREAILSRCATEWDALGRPTGEVRCKNDSDDSCGCAPGK